MQQKFIKYWIGIIILAVVVYNSIYIKKLSQIKAETKVEAKFDPQAYAKNYLSEKLPKNKNKAVAVNDLLGLLKTDSKKAFTTYGHSQNESDTKYFMIKGQGQVTAIDEEHVVIKEVGSGKELKLAIQYIFGNAARDCSGLIAIDEFDNTMDLNNVSEEINKLIRTELATSFAANVKKGDSVSFTAALELNQSDPKTDEIEIIPLSLEINAKKG